jgi:hypothetical protein
MELLADIGGEMLPLAAPSRPLRHDTVPSLPQNHVLRESHRLLRRADLECVEGERAGRGCKLSFGNLN